MHARLLALALLISGLAFAGCGDDDGDPSTRDDGGSDGGDDNPPDDRDDSGPTRPPRDGGSRADAAADSGEPQTDADVDPDDDAGEPEEMAMFEVPAGGGQFEYMTPSGDRITFDFPASAAGIDITITALDPDDVEWGDNQLADSFSSVIELGPDGQEFDDPIEVVVSGGAVIAFNFSEPGGVPEPLELNGDGDALLLTHFSTLAVVAPNQSCESSSGWNDTADSQSCAEHGSASTYRSYGCKNFQFCYAIEASCCVEPGDPDEDCRIGDAALTLVYTRTDSNGGMYPYCDMGLAAAAPYVSDYSPDMLTANSTDQIITLTGTGFDPGGSVFTNLDGLIATTWVSATQVTATVPGGQLTAAGSLNDVGYANPTAAATGACAPGNPGNCDWVNRSNVVDIPIAAVVIDTDPTLTDIAPDMLIANSTMQTITLTGTNFDPDGAVFHNLDIPLDTTWVSATQVTAVVPGSQLTAAGTLSQVGFVNPTSAATGPCEIGMTGNCDWSNRSNTLDVTIVAAPANPTVSGIMPAALTANGTMQSITLTGTNFNANGSVFINQDMAIMTTWNSATEAVGVVPGSFLLSAGTLNDVGFVNPTSSATGACTSSAPSNCDWPNRSNLNNVTINAPP